MRRSLKNLVTKSQNKPAGHRHKIKIMKKVNVSVRELPFRLDQHFHADDVVTVSMQDSILLVETPEGEDITSFEALSDVEDWFDSLPRHRFFEPVPALGQEVDLIVNGELVFGTVTEINDKFYEVTNSLGKKAYVSINQ